MGCILSYSYQSRCKKYPLSLQSYRLGSNSKLKVLSPAKWREGQSCARLSETLCGLTEHLCLPASNTQSIQARAMAGQKPERKLASSGREAWLGEEIAQEIICDCCTRMGTKESRVAHAHVNC